MKKILQRLKVIGGDRNFLDFSHYFENIVAKILAIALQSVILVGLLDLIVFLVRDLNTDPVGFFSKNLIELFGLFLNILIALELLENITGYLKKHVVQVELVLVTALIAISRKIIIFDLEKYDNNDLIGLGVAILALAVSYWLVKRVDIKGEG